ncbi:hypothetical protein I3843_14G132900 [Carya illinoinensis]|nr:hypothetical protein I3843_14G132900 [Carya illinoinensis]
MENVNDAVYSFFRFPLFLSFHTRNPPFPRFQTSLPSSLLRLPPSSLEIYHTKPATKDLRSRKLHSHGTPPSHSKSTSKPLPPPSKPKDTKALPLPSTQSPYPKP